jgi:hypothetical protein
MIADAQLPPPLGFSVRWAGDPLLGLESPIQASEPWCGGEIPGVLQYIFKAKCRSRHSEGSDQTWAPKNSGLSNVLAEGDTRMTRP